MADPASAITVNLWLRSSGGTLDNSQNGHSRMSTALLLWSLNARTSTIFVFLAQVRVLPSDFRIVPDDDAEL